MNPLKACLTVLIGMLFTGCNLDIIGPAHPEKNADKYLSEHGYATEVIRAVVERLPIEHRRILEFVHIPSASVRFLVASNPNLTQDEIDLFLKDRDDFARSGTACNPNLTPSQIERLTADLSHTVYCKLAGNTFLSESELLRLRKTRSLGIPWFSMNPNCPESIRKEILLSDDLQAKHGLDITERWKKGGVYLQGADGRWHKPKPQ